MNRSYEPNIELSCAAESATKAAVMKGTIAADQSEIFGDSFNDLLCAEAFSFNLGA
jgi:hypothetical protein